MGTVLHRESVLLGWLDHEIVAWVSEVSFEQQSFILYYASQATTIDNGYIKCANTQPGPRARLKGPQPGHCNCSRS
jgi:hypothetical protein